MTPEGTTNNQRRPLVVGEVLFDVLPDGTRVLGGAPLNVAWHLEAFGLRPFLITRVGSDNAGDEVIEAMERWGMDTSGVQRDASHATGEVQVELENGQPTFHILPDQAYDHIDGDLAQQSVAQEVFSVLYHGSLISRGEASRTALEHVKRETEIPVFTDVNLREPWWTLQDVVASVQRARWVKVNEAELAVLAGASGSADADVFRIEHGLEVVIVTRGSRGATVADSGGINEAAPPADIEIVDTVGAGDAFSALFILGITMGWPNRRILARALEFAAAVCTVPGATVSDHDFYSRFSERGWW